MFRGVGKITGVLFVVPLASMMVFAGIYATRKGLQASKPSPGDRPRSGASRSLQWVQVVSLAGSLRERRMSAFELS